MFDLCVCLSFTFFLLPPLSLSSSLFLPFSHSHPLCFPVSFSFSFYRNTQKKRLSLIRLPPSLHRPSKDANTNKRCPLLHLMCLLCYPLLQFPLYLITLARPVFLSLSLSLSIACSPSLFGIKRITSTTRLSKNTRNVQTTSPLSLSLSLPRSIWNRPRIDECREGYCLWTRTSSPL